VQPEEGPRPWTGSAINDQKRRMGLDWAFRDLRSKAQSDSPHWSWGMARP
jgi:hypothetical protein